MEFRWVDTATRKAVSRSPSLTSVQAEGYTRQEITFSGTVNIKQIGHAILTLSQHNESYLIPLPNVKVKGLVSGTPYPELSGTYVSRRLSSFSFLEYASHV